MKTTANKLEKRIEKARIGLILDHCFFGTLITKLDMVLNDTFPTMATDGKMIYYNAGFTESLTDSELLAVLAHEVLHVANGHAWRRDNRDRFKWNIAADYAINSILTECDLTLPKCALVAPSAGKAAEWHYAHLPKQSQQEQKRGAGGGGKGSLQGEPGKNPGKGQASDQPSDPGGCGEVLDAPEEENADGTKTGAKEQEAEWRVAVAQAAEAARSQGNLPAGLDRMVQEIVNPKVPWNVVLRDFVERTAKNDYNWSRPNLRYSSRGICLPTLISDELPEIVIAVDTSGSIGIAEVNQFAAEVSDILGQYETIIRIVYVDSAVAHAETLTRADLPLKLHPKGGGGTDFRSAYSWVAQEGLTPAALIYFTDGYGTFPNTEPEYPVIWVVVGTKKEFPFGQVVPLE